MISILLNGRKVRIMDNGTNTQDEVKLVLADQRKKIQKEVIKLERSNYYQKEYNSQEMISKIKKIIESEVSK